jgi:hypothetical protein
MQTIILMKDGTAILQGKVCPFRNPLVLPSQSIAGQITIQNIPCSDSCPHFKVDGENLILTCGANKVQLSYKMDFQGDIEDRERLAKQKSNLKLI